MLREKMQMTDYTDYAELAQQLRDRAEVRAGEMRFFPKGSLSALLREAADAIDTLTPRTVLAYVEILRVAEQIVLDLAGLREENLDEFGIRPCCPTLDHGPHDPSCPWLRARAFRDGRR